MSSSSQYNEASACIAVTGLSGTMYLCKTPYDLNGLAQLAASILRNLTALL
jgi:hypothetical protein